MFKTLRKHKSVLLVFIPFEGEKTAEAVCDVVTEQLKRVGMEESQQNSLFCTTDEGTNVVGLGGNWHIKCMAHFGALMAKRATKPYRLSRLPDLIKETVEKCDESLDEMEQFVRKMK